MTVEWHFCPVQPVHVYCPLPLAGPPDCGDGCETMLNSSRLTLRGVKGISHEFASATEYSCYTVISSTWWVLLVTMKIMMGGTDDMTSSLSVDGLIGKAGLSAVPWVQPQ